MVAEERPRSKAPIGNPSMMIGPIIPVGTFSGWVVIKVTAAAAATSNPRLPVVAD